MEPRVLQILADLGVLQKDVAAALRVTPQTVNDWYREKKPLPSAHVYDLWALAALVKYRVAAGMSPREACQNFNPIAIQTPEGGTGLSLRIPIPAHLLPDLKAANEARTLHAVNLFQLDALFYSMLPYLEREPESLNVEELEQLRQMATAVGHLANSLQMGLAGRTEEGS